MQVTTLRLMAFGDMRMRVFAESLIIGCRPIIRRVEQRAVMRAVMPTSVPWAFLLVGIVTMQMPEQGLAMLEKEPLDIDVRSESVHSKELLHDISQPAERRAGADVIEGLLTSSAHTSSSHKDHSGGQVTKIQTDAPLDYVDHLLSQQWLDTASIRWPATSAADANEASEGAATANFLMADGKGKVANGTANESLGVERADIEEENPDGTVFLATLENPAPEEIQKTWRGRVVDILAVLVVASGYARVRTHVRSCAHATIQESTNWTLSLL